MNFIKNNITTILSLVLIFNLTICIYIFIKFVSKEKQIDQTYYSHENALADDTLEASVAVTSETQQQVNEHFIEYKDAYNLLIWFSIYGNTEQYEKAYDMLHTDYIKELSKSYTKVTYGTRLNTYFKSTVLFTVKNHYAFKDGYRCKIYYFYSSDGINKLNKDESYVIDVDILYDEIAGSYKLYPLKTMPKSKYDQPTYSTDIDEKETLYENDIDIDGVINEEATLGESESDGVN